MMTEKRRLGKGLDTLLSSTRLQQIDQETSSNKSAISPRIGETISHDSIQQIPIEKLQLNPHQPRQEWDDKKLYELADSIKTNGLIQPVIVRPMGRAYQLIAGERRLRAMQIAGKTSIPAIVRSASEEQVLEWALVENIHRKDLNSIERARAYQNYLKRFSLTQQQAAQRLGEDRSNLANYIRLLELSSDIQKMLARGAITMGHARALLGISDPLQRKLLAEMIINKKLSVRETERQVQADLLNKKKTRITPPPSSPHLMELERELSSSVGTKVTIKTAGRKGQRGKIIIEFYNLDDFDRIKEKLQT